MAQPGADTIKALGVLTRLNSAAVGLLGPTAQHGSAPFGPNYWAQPVHFPAEYHLTLGAIRGPSLWSASCDRSAPGGISTRWCNAPLSCFGFEPARLRCLPVWR